MVNLVVRHGNHVQTTVSSPLIKSPSPLANRVNPIKTPVASGGNNTPSGSANRLVPSPIRVPHLRSHTNAHRPMSPLTASESMFIHSPPVPGRAHSSDSTTEERQQPSIGSNSELVCDYDHSITQLYEMLESSQWEQARIRCRTHPDEVHTWIVRRDANDKIRWKLLPLHAAVIFQAPMPVIEAMLKENPVAAAKRDDQGMLPLHLAFRHKSDETMIEKLIRQYPGGVTIKDSRDRLPLDHAKEGQFSFHMMKLYSEVYGNCLDSERPDRSHEMETTANNLHETRIATIKEAYEARINAMIKEHDQAIRDIKADAEKNAHVAQKAHDSEMDQLRDLLSREVATGQKVARLENSLAESNQESKVLRRVVHEQKNQQSYLIDQMKQILKDQKSLHEFCMQQQEQLDQAHQLREQLLRTLLQKEDGKAIRVSSEVCQMSSKILARTEKVLKDASLASTDMENVIGDTTAHAATGVVAAATTAATAAANLADATNAAAWEAMGNSGDVVDHGDDISAITENSNF